ncbi:MAG TPA: MFS transporter [Stellaceae bacterium]|jgi:CP family cyanate transporter-like MFS transporter|nr:MFS transporter [Stellaceae bacterium]
MAEASGAVAGVRRPYLLLIGILLIATNLRAPFTGVPPVMSMIQASFALGSIQAGILTTLPLLAFAVMSPFMASFARGYGLERCLFAAIALIALGIAIRPLGSLWWLYAGTGAIGIGITFGNVLLPSLLKRDFPHRIAAITSAYFLAMNLTAACVSAAAVPIAQASGLGWTGALLAVMVLPAMALLAWLPQLRKHTSPLANTAMPPKGGRIWRSALAWQVTLCMGTNSVLFYIMISWLPAVFISSGYNATEAGSLHGIMQLSGALSGLVMGPIVQRMHDQRAAAVLTGLLTALGLLGLLFLPGWGLFWAICIGSGLGASFLLSLIFIGLRTQSPRQAAALSGMAQCAGYFLAAFGPPASGAIHDATGTWYLPLAICIVLALVMSAFGYLAGRKLQIPEAAA